MAAPAVETMITVKQHGFIVKDSLAAVSPPPGLTERPQPLRLEDGIGGAGSSGLSLGLLSGLTPQSAAAAPSTSTYGISPGLPRPGDVRLAEHTHLTPGVKRIMRSVVRGLKAHQDPEAAIEGLGGTYFFRNESGHKIAIMKPCDEEPLAPNNPKGFVGRQLGDPGLKPTVRVGEAATREVAAYLLDYDHFAKVPHTVMVRMSHPVFHIAAQPTPGPTTPAAAAAIEADDSGELYSSPEVDDSDLPLKLGSLQEFVPHQCDTSEVGASRFSVRDVQRIGILDVRLLNTDRHAGNILVRRAPIANSTPSALSDFNLKDQYELIPIDHGFALPESLEPPYFEWQHWPQAMMPFGMEELEYIAKLDPKADAELLRRELPSLREESLRVLEVSTTLLKRCAAAGLSLAEIANVVTRPLIGLDDEPSELENICQAAREEVAAEAAASLSDTGSEAGEDYSDDEDDNLSDVDEETDEGYLEAAATALANVAIEDVQGLQGDTSPGAESSATHYALPLSSDNMNVAGGPSSNRARSIPDDALFSMDEDGTRTPAPGSPDIPSGLARLKAHAPSLVVKRTGEMGTPGGVVGMSFGSALASADSVSPPASSYDSESPSGENNHREPLGRGTSVDSLGGAFKGPATYVAGFGTAMKAAQRPGKSRQRRRLGGRANGRKQQGKQAYPPLVEPRCGTVPSTAPFTGMSAPEWEHFMRVFVAKIDDALASSVWVQSSGKGQAPLMSCPKF